MFGPPLIPVLRQMHSVHNVPFYFPEIHSNIIFPSTPRSSTLSFPWSFWTKILYAFLIPPMRAAYTAHRIFLDLITLTVFGEAYKLGSILQSPATSSLLGPNIPLSTMFLNTLNLCSSFNVRDHSTSIKKKQQVKLWFCTFKSVSSWNGDGKTKKKKLWTER